MEMILQQVAGSQMVSLLDGFSGYNQIKVKREKKYKTTFITLRTDQIILVILKEFSCDAENLAFL